MIDICLKENTGHVHVGSLDKNISWPFLLVKCLKDVFGVKLPEYILSNRYTMSKSTQL